MAVVYISSLRMEGEAIKESVVHESTETRSRARRGWRMAMANNSSNSISSSAMSDVFIALFTFLAHF